MSILEKNEEGDKRMSQREVAEALGISRVAVQQAELRAFKKIAKYLKERGLKKEDFI
jgi:DNA-directed RNA polymerase specialized sigma subunit